MSVTYKNPPLVEIITELRWGPPAQEVRDGNRAVFRLRGFNAKDEEVFMHFAAIAAQNDYSRLERLVPAGIPFPVNQVVCRFRPTDPTRPSPMFQIGAGIFAANGVPPYRSWETFVPEVRRGVGMLFESHDRAGLPKPPIAQALVRYIDVFQHDLTIGKDPSEFTRDVLGLRVELPKGVTDLVIDRDRTNVSTQIEMPIALGAMKISIGPTFKGNERGVMLDTSVLVTRDIGPDVDRAIGVLTEARGVVHNMFQSMTERIRAEMQPL